MEAVFEIFGSVFFLAQKWQTLADKEVFPRVQMTIKQWMLVVILEKFYKEYPPTIMQAADSYGTSRQNIKRMALDLQKSKFLIISPDPEDKRIQRLILTGRHKQYFQGDDNISWQKNFIENFFIGLTDKEINSLNTSLKILIQRTENIF